ncbi:MAG: M48 family metalloprotease, partial [Gaiellaceae bacterium]
AGGRARIGRRLPRALLLLALAGLWAAAAWFLWQSEVPGDLRLPELDAATEFTAVELDRAEDYEGFLRWEFVVSQAAVLAVFALYAVFGARFARESAAGRIGTGMLLAMLGLGFLWLVQLPIGLIRLWWERKHDVSEVSYWEWVVGTWFGLGFGFLFICLAIVIVMGLAGPLHDRWWIPGGAVFIGLATLFAYAVPYLLPGQVPLRDPEVADDARRLAAELDVRDIPIKVQELGGPPNAAAAGLGPSRRVILTDTLVDGPFSQEEVRVVLAHEFGHHARDHIWKSIGWYALFAFPGAFLIARATQRRGGMRDPTAVPLSLFVLVALSFLALPVENAITRHMEEEADWVALEATEDPKAAKDLFRRFSTTTRSDPSPPGWAYVLIANHPSLLERIAMAEAWEARRGGR